MDPDPFAGHSGSRFAQQLFKARPRNRSVPPRAQSQREFRKGELVAVGEKAFTARLEQPLREPFAGRIPRIRIVISGGDKQRRLPPQSPKVLFNDDDLNVGIQQASNVEQIAADRHHVIRIRVRDQPVELLQAVVQVSDVKDFHSISGECWRLNRHRHDPTPARNSEREILYPGGPGRNSFRLRARKARRLNLAFDKAIWSPFRKTTTLQQVREALDINFSFVRSVRLRDAGRENRPSA